MSFSEKEVDELKMLAFRMVSAPMRTFLLDVVEGRRCKDNSLGLLSNALTSKNALPKASNIDIAVSLIRQLKVSDFVGHQEIAWPEHDLKLIIRLSAKVPRDHDLEVRVAKKYYKTIYDHMDKLVGLTQAYYVELMTTNAALAAVLREIFGDEAQALALNVANRTLFIGLEDKHRLGITCFYIDSEGSVVPTVDDTMLTTKK